MVSAIGRELVARQGEIAPNRVQTLYFGGGTPSVCSPEEIGQLIRTVREVWDIERFDELTVEANPDDLSPAYLERLRALGVDRLSIGVQSFDDDHLQRMNRRHNAQGAIDAVRNARAAGFDNLTIDLIYGLPGMTPDQWIGNLDRAVSLGVQHISAYHLTIEPHTVFGRQGLRPVAEEVSELHFRLLRERLTGAGFEHYEVSNFARPGFRARHNSAYWQGEPYLGVGPSAHSYDGAEKRSWNVADNDRYLAGTPPETERLTATDRMNEYLMTRLRTSEGISAAEFTARFGETETRRLERRTERFEATGDLCRTPFGWIIPPERWLISDFVIAELFGE